MPLGWPTDPSWYKLLTDWGGFIGAIIAFTAALIAYAAVRAQTKEAQREYHEHRDLARRSTAQETLVSAYIMEAALEGFKWDLYGVLNIFDPGSDDRAFLDTTIEKERV